MKSPLDLLLVILMPHPAFRAQFGSRRRSEEQIAKMTLDQRAEGYWGIVGWIRRHLTDLCSPRLSRIKWGAAACFPYILMCVMCASLITLPFQSSILANMAEGGIITGELTDPFGEVVAGAQVIATIQNRSTPSSGKSFEAFSDNDGIFALTDLPVGIYTITVQAAGFKSRTINLVRVTKSKTTKLTISLKVDKACGDAKGPSRILKERDKAEIVRQILERVFVTKDLPGPRFLLNQRKQIVLSTEQVKPSWISSHAQVEFILLDKQKITEMASKTGDFQYLRFYSFETNGPCIAVTLTHEWAVDMNSDRSYNLDGGGDIYEFHKVGNKWIGNYASGWIS